MRRSQVYLHIAGTLEFFVDHVIHARAGIDQCGGDNGEGAAFLHIACRAKEAFGALQRVRIHTAASVPCRKKDYGVVGACQTGDGVKQNNDIFLVFHQALGFFQHHFGDLHMAGGGFVKG